MCVAGVLRAVLHACVAGKGGQGARSKDDGALGSSSLLWTLRVHLTSSALTSEVLHARAAPAQRAEGHTIREEQDLSRTVQPWCSRFHRRTKRTREAMRPCCEGDAGLGVDEQSGGALKDGGQCKTERLEGPTDTLSTTWLATICQS